MNQNNFFIKRSVCDFIHGHIGELILVFTLKGQFIANDVATFFLHYF